MYVEEDIIDSSIHATIEEVRAYYRKDSNCWYLTVTYSYKDKDGSSKELEIPAIPLPLPQNHLPVIRDTDCGPSILFESEVMLKMSTCHNLDGSPLREPKGFFSIKQMIKDMTKDDIEKALGYPINIIEEEKK